MPFVNGTIDRFARNEITVNSTAELGTYQVAATKGTIQELALSTANPRTNNMRTEYDLMINIRNSPGPTGLNLGEHNHVRWPDTFNFFNTQNTELD